MLGRRGLRAQVYDGGGTVGGAWLNRYDALRLNTVRWMSDLPGSRMPSTMGRWVDRDAMVRYLQDYADWHQIGLRLDTTVDRLDPLPDGRWSVSTTGRRSVVDAVVVATGHSRRARVPAWPGREEFEGRFLHSSRYRNAGGWSGRRVVVVGAGSSGGEIVVDLVAGGCEVIWSVRTAPRLFPREVANLPATPLGPIADLLPTALVDRTAPWLERAVYGRRDYLPEPPAPMMQMLASCKEPMTADGIVELVRSGGIEVVPAVRDLSPSGVVLTDERTFDADIVIAATGYRPGLEDLVGHLGVLDDDGRPRSLSPRPGLGFVGYRIPLTGTLWAIETDARRVAGMLAAPSVAHRRKQVSAMAGWVEPGHDHNL